METYIHNVRDIDADKLRSLEHVLGHDLDADQQVVIRVSNVVAEPDEETRSNALANAAEIARRGRANASAQGVSDEEANAAIEEAIRHVRQQKRNG